MNGDIFKRFEQSVARYEADPSKAAGVKFDWWPGKVFAAVGKKVEEVGPEDCTVRTYRGIKEDGHTPEIWHEVRETPDGKKDPGIWLFNESRPCPPDCPPDWP